jgi:hypothetical protein
MMAATVEAGETFRVTDRQRLFALPAGFNIAQVNVLYDVTPDDQRFIGVRDVSAVAEVTYPLILVENWTGEIRERVRQGGG